MTEIEYHYESRCEHCGDVKLSENGEDFTLRADVKEEYHSHMPTDHDCEYTEHYELEEPEVVEPTL